jgi:REP element-mobilizing transposase RayT
MPQSLVSLLVHVVFSTKHRAAMIAPEIEADLFAFMAGVLKNHDSRLLAANGTDNHVHLLITQSKNVALSLLIQELKKSTSKWIKTRGAKFKDFQWQDGYGAFSIGESNVPALRQYIARQKEKHRKKSFENELVEFLRKYGIAYDEKYVWD